MIPTPTAKMASRSRFRQWLEAQKRDRATRPALQNAGIAILSGDPANDPYGALVKGIVGYALGKQDFNEKQRVLDLQQEQQRYERTRDERDFSLKKGQYDLQTTAMKADLEAKAAERLRREQQLEAFKAAIPSLPPEEQQIAIGMAEDPELFRRWMDDQASRRAKQAEFEQTIGETRRHNRANESQGERGLSLESQRVDISRESLKQKGFDRRVVNGRVVVIDKSTNQVVSEEPIPVSEKDRAALIQRHAAGNFIPLDQAAAEVDSLLGSAPATARQPVQLDREAAASAKLDAIIRSFPVGDPRRKEIEDARNDPGATDLDILTAIERR